MFFNNTNLQECYNRLSLYGKSQGLSLKEFQGGLAEEFGFFVNSKLLEDAFVFAEIDSNSITLDTLRDLINTGKQNVYLNSNKF